VNHGYDEILDWARQGCSIYIIVGEGDECLANSPWPNKLGSGPMDRRPFCGTATNCRVGGKCIVFGHIRNQFVSMLPIVTVSAVTVPIFRSYRYCIDTESKSYSYYS